MDAKAWGALLTTYRVLVLTGIGAIILYLKSIFVTHEQLASTFDPLRPIPAKVAEISALTMTGADTLKELGIWRVHKDEAITRLITLVETQQYMLLRQQNILDRQQEQLNTRK